MLQRESSFSLSPTPCLCLASLSFHSSLFSVLCLSSRVYFLALTLPLLSFFPHLSAPPSSWKPRGQSEEFFSCGGGAAEKALGPGAGCRDQGRGVLVPPALEGPLPLLSKSPAAQSEKPLGLPCAQPHQQRIKRDGNVTSSLLPKRQQMERA